MKIKYNVLLLICILMTFYTNAQDIITKRNGDDIKAKVLEITQTEIKYKRFESPDGPSYSLLKSDVLLIRYKDGTKDIFNSDLPKEAESKPTHEPLAILPKPKEPIRNDNVNNTKKERKDGFKPSETLMRLTFGLDAGSFEVEKIYGRKRHWGWGLKAGANYDFYSNWGYAHFVYRYPVDIYNNKYKKGNGLFIWANTGVIYTTVQSTFDNYGNQLSGGSDFNWRFEVGFDCSFKKSRWGITLYIANFNSLWLGPVFKF